MLKLTVFDVEQVVQVGMPIRVQNIRTERVFTTHVGLIRGTCVAVFEDDAIYVFSSDSRKDDTEMYQLADNATLTFH
ncbi:hypothetical protein KVP40.0223 [Vibrio phage KVP40]|uniref:Uncharacterized protein n=3 Tax=Schizotequatrovirus KVP40 TaxID=1914019 RepID=Q6WHT1_BPKVM|nr:hypothetical protein KVP40.0223 [Vibrio phage KVP40]AAQ64292.1 hypothetical protein KVP40.0223 [Vibrio phage KVP40]AFN37453.1 hypothetical protein pp2_220 [Vibrio phage phi-pp2]QIW91191.1 hypothetical protein COHAPHLL_00355 [Vibrio phage V09]